jgi:hypothetical protein
MTIKFTSIFHSKALQNLTKNGMKMEKDAASVVSLSKISVDAAQFQSSVADNAAKKC